MAPSHQIQSTSDFTIRPARADDESGAYYVCLKTGDFGQDGEPFYREDPDALGRIFVGSSGKAHEKSDFSVYFFAGCLR